MKDKERQKAVQSKKVDKDNIIETRPYTYTYVRCWVPLQRLPTSTAIVSW